MTPNAAFGRVGSTGPDPVHLFQEWVRLLRHLRGTWKNARTLDTKLGKQHKPGLEFFKITAAPKGQAKVMRSVRGACGDSHRCPSPLPKPEMLVPAQFLIMMGKILGLMQRAFFVISWGWPGAIHFALDYAKAELIRVPWRAKRIEGDVVDRIPSQIGDTKSKWRPRGVFWQWQPVCGEEMEGTLRGKAATVPTPISMVVAECDSDDPEMQADSEVIGDNIPLPCAAMVDTGNRGPHRFFVFPTEERESIKAFFDGIWEMLGFDPTGWDGSKMARFPNTGRGKGRGGKPQTQTLLWFAPTPTRLNPDSKFQTLDQFKAAFIEAVGANVDAIREECKQMETAIALLETQIAEGNQRLGRKSKSGCKAKASKSPSSGEHDNSGDVQARRDMSGPAFREGRTLLQERLRSAGDNLVLTTEEKTAVVDILSEHHTFYADPKANCRELAGIVDEICATPDRPIGKGRHHGNRPAQNVSDEEYYKSLNFPYVPGFWATDRLRAWKQRTEECYVEFAFVVLLLHERGNMSHSDIFKWLKAFDASRPSEPCAPHIEVPGQETVSDRVREITEGILTPDQAKKFLGHWGRNYGCEGDMDALLSTTTKHLYAAGWDPWVWIDEDLYRLEEKYWDKELAPCGAYRLDRIMVAVEAIFADQVKTTGKLLKVTTEMVCAWLETHPEHDFPIYGCRNKHKAKLTSILRGLRELAKTGRLRESGDGHKKVSGKERIFRPSKTGPNPLTKLGVTDQLGDSRATHKAYYKGDGAGVTLNPTPANSPVEAATPIPEKPLILPPTETPVAKADSTSTNSGTQAPGAQANQPAPEPDSAKSAAPAAEAKKARKPKKPDSQEVAEQKAADKAANAYARAEARFAKAAVEADQKAANVQARADSKAAKVAKARSRGIVGETFHLQEDPQTGQIRVGRYERGLVREEAVGKYYRKKVAPFVSHGSVILAVETMEKDCYGKFIVTGLLRLDPPDENRLLEEGTLKSKNFLQDAESRNYIRVQCKLAEWNIPDDFCRSNGDFRLEACKAVRIVSLQSKRVLPRYGDRDTKPYWVLEITKHEMVQSPALSNLIEARQLRFLEQKKHREDAKAKQAAK